jgi:hypothetical protein
VVRRTTASLVLTIVPTIVLTAGGCSGGGTPKASPSKSGLSRSSSIFVRRGNLLVYVDYGRWHYPSREAMDKEVIALAQAVLAGD